MNFFKLSFTIISILLLGGCGLKSTKNSTKTPIETNNNQNSKVKSEEPGGCVDLIVDAINVIKARKKVIKLEVLIKNIGTKTAKLFGENGNWDDLILQAYISGTDKLSRGDFKVGEFKAQSYDFPKIIPPNGIGKIQIKVNISKKTRYTRILIIYIDTFNTFEECDNTNNYNSIIL